MDSRINYEFQSILNKKFDDGSSFFRNFDVGTIFFLYNIVKYKYQYNARNMPPEHRIIRGDGSYGRIYSVGNAGSHRASEQPVGFLRMAAAGGEGRCAGMHRMARRGNRQPLPMAAGDRNAALPLADRDGRGKPAGRRAALQLRNRTMQPGNSGFAAGTGEKKL